MYIIENYKNYTITHKLNSDKWFITYPNEIDSSVFTLSLEKAHQFIDEMTSD